MKRKWILPGILALMIIMLLAACDKRVVFVGSSSDTNNQIKASYSLFTGTDEKKVNLKSGETLAVDYRSEVAKGDLTIKLYDPDNQLLKALSTNKSGNEKIEADKAGTYRFEITGSSAKGSYEITYKIE